MPNAYDLKTKKDFARMADYFCESGAYSKNATKLQGVKNLS